MCDLGSVEFYNRDCKLENILMLLKDFMALVAQLDLGLTGDQEVAGLTLAGSATFFRGD